MFLFVVPLRRNEAAALGVAEFKRCGLMDSLPGPATRLSIGCSTSTGSSS
jgi:hypothetical protein